MDSHHSQTHKSNENETVGGGELPPLDQLLATYARKGEPIRTRDYPDYDELEMLEAMDEGGWTEKRGVWWPPTEETR